MKKYLKEGGISRYDLANDNFDKKAIEPVKRKDMNTAEILIDNFLTKNSCGGSTEISKNH
jgi:hypothetical protein